MKSLLLFALSLVLLTACSPNAQLVTLRGNNVKPQSEGLVLDTDTLTLRYNFSSERGQMRLSLVNKLDRPLYVDWKRSSFIIGQDKLDYWYDVANVDLTGSSFSGRYSRYTIGALRGTISKEDPIAFIPPQTRVDKQQFVVVPSESLRLPGTPEVVQERSTFDLSHKKPVVVNVYNYAAEQSPLQFCNYLTLSTDKDFKTEFHIDTQFWASDVRVLPKDQITGTIIRHYDGSYSPAQSFNKPDGFYIPLPVQ